MNEKKTERIFIKIEPSIKEAAQNRAEEEDRTLSRYIAELIKDDVKESRKMYAVKTDRWTKVVDNVEKANGEIIAEFEKGMKVKNFDEAMDDYKYANRDKRSAEYGVLMFDFEDGEMWTDMFSDIGGNSYNAYDSGSIVNLGFEMRAREIEINKKNVKSFLENRYHLTV